MTEGTKNLIAVAEKIVNRKAQLNRELGMTGEQGGYNIDDTLNDFDRVKEDIDENPALKHSELIQKLRSCAQTMYDAYTKQQNFLNGSEMETGLFGENGYFAQMAVGMIQTIENAEDVKSVKRSFESEILFKFRKLSGEVNEIKDDLIASKRNYQAQKSDIDAEREELSEEVDEIDNEQQGGKVVPPMTQKQGGKRGGNGAISLPP